MSEPTNELRADVHKWMVVRLQSEPGWKMSSTTLAEEAADIFNLCAEDFDATIPEWVFEMAASTTDFWGEKFDDLVSDVEYSF